MPSILASKIGASQASQTAFPAMNPGMMNMLQQFRGMFGGILSAQNPGQAVQAILQQRGISPDQIQGLINQYAAQATEIQRQLMGR